MQSFSADAVVCTLPLGVLKAADVRFAAIETACKLMYCCSLHDLCPSGEVIELCEGAIDADMGALDPGRLLGLLKSYEDLGLIMDPELRTRLVAEINAKEERAEAGDLALEETIFN